MKLYRVYSPKWEDCEYVNLPGGGTSSTGFWTVDLEASMDLLKDRNHSCQNATGGGSWSRIFSTDTENVVLAGDIKPYKSSHNDRYDIGEVFVVSIIDMSLVIEEEAISKACR